MEGLDVGEGAAIALAIELHADLLLTDDEEGVTAARRKGLKVTGTLGVGAQVDGGFEGSSSGPTIGFFPNVYAF